ncbi:hypothetical protein ROSI111154_14495 [Rouxiella silvae]
MILTAHRPVEKPVKRKGSLKPYIFLRFIRRGNKIPIRRRIDSSKPTYRQNRCCKNGSDHRFRFPSGPLIICCRFLMTILRGPASYSTTTCCVFIDLPSITARESRSLPRTMTLNLKPRSIPFCSRQVHRPAFLCLFTNCGLPVFSTCRKNQTVSHTVPV